MTTMTRTDIHRPTEMDPADYRFIGCFDAGIDLEVDLDPTGARQALQEWGWKGARPGQCDHCGARARYYATLLHVPTGEAIKVGETCLDNRFSLESKAQFDAIRKAAADARAEQRIKTAATEYVESLLDSSDPVAKRLGQAMERDVDLSEMVKPGWALSTFTDIRSKVWNRYGQPTDRQQDLLIRLLDEGAAYFAAQAERVVAPEVPKVQAPSGRHTFEGKVVFRKGYENDYGYTVKIVVVVTTPEGEWSVFVTEPSAIQTEKGDIVRMTATLTPGELGKAKGSRPSKAEILVPAGEEIPSSLD